MVRFERAGHPVEAVHYWQLVPRHLFLHMCTPSLCLSIPRAYITFILHTAVASVQNVGKRDFNGVSPLMCEEALLSPNGDYWRMSDASLMLIQSGFLFPVCCTTVRRSGDQT